MSTGKPYRGINLFLLGSGFWGTYKKVAELGGQIRKGERSSVAVFWKFIDSVDANGKESKIPLLRYYNVFHEDQADWPDGKPARFEAEVLPGSENERVAAAEQVVTGYKKSENAPRFDAEGWDVACYVPASDSIRVPALEQFDSSAHYYSTLFHECAHSTGHASRLNRDGVTDAAMFGSHTYAREELVAEMTAAILCGEVGLLDDTVEMSAAYLKHWRDIIANDNRLIVKAAGEAQRAADLIRGVRWDNDDE
jgi:antirestriction protein ArdC